MKKMMLIAAVSFISAMAVAQPKIRGNAGRYGTIRQSQPAKVIVVRPGLMYNGFGMGYGCSINPYRYSPYGFSPFNSAYPYRNYNALPTALELDIEEIRNDFSQKIDAVKEDKSLTRQERKQQVKALKHDRDDAIIDAKRKYVKNS